MGEVATLTSSTVGKKVVMAGTGFFMVFFVFVHMTGNMLVFVGQEEFDHYAHWLQSGFGASPEFLWAFRLVLIASVVLHIISAASLSARNRAARTTRYAGSLKSQKSGYATKFMGIGGIVLILFVLFHLSHLTLGWTHPAGETFSKANAYNNLVAGLSVPAVAGLYALANAALGLHLYHGVFSGAKTFGVSEDTWGGWQKAAIAIAASVAGGNILITIAIVSGLVK